MPRIFSILAIALTLFIPQVSSAAEERGLFGSIGCFFSSIFSDGCDTTEAVSVVSTQTNTQVSEQQTNTYIPPYNPPAQQDPEPQEERTIIKYITETLTPPPSVSVSGSGASYVYVDEQINLLKQELLERINNTTTRSSDSSSGISRDTLRKSIDSALDGTATDTDIDNLREEIMETIAALPTSSGGESFWTESGSDIYFDGGRVGIGGADPNFVFNYTDSLLEIVGGKLYLNNGGDGIYLDDGINNTNEGGLFFSGADEKIATYNPSDQIYNYANGDLVVKGGNIGIGTADPTAKLHIQGVNEDNYIKLVRPYGEYTNGFEMNFTDYGEGGGFGSATMYLNPEEGFGVYRIDPNSDYNSSFTLAHNAVGMSFSSSGISSNFLASADAFVFEGANVGIGTPEPTAKLHVQGALGGVAQIMYSAIDYDGMYFYTPDDDLLYGGSYTLRMNPEEGFGVLSNNSFLGVGLDEIVLQSQNVIVDSRAARFGTNTNGYAYITDDWFGGEIGLMGNLDDAIAVRMSDGSYQYGGGTPGDGNLTVEAGGNVGIGTVDPEAKLDIRGIDGQNIAQILSDSVTYNSVYFSSHDISSDNFGRTIFNMSPEEGYQLASISEDTLVQSGIYMDPRGDALNLISTGSGGIMLNSTTKIILDGSNVGIGTSDPLASLQVNTEEFSGEKNGLIVYGGSETNPESFYIAQFKTWGAGNALVIDGEGNVAIGDTSSGSRTFEVYGASEAIAYFSGPSGRSILIGDNSAGGSGFGDTGQYGLFDDNDQLIVGRNAIANVYQFADGFVSVNPSGRLGLGTTTPTQALSVVGNAQFTSVTSGTYAFDLNLTSDGTLTTSASDRRLKDNIESLNASSTLEKMLQLQPSSFTWKADGTADIGLIAQDVATVFPELTFTNPTDQYMGVNYSRLSTLLISAVQEIMKKIEGFADRFETKELCLGATCIDEAELQELLELRDGGVTNNESVTTGGNSDQAPSGDPTPVLDPGLEEHTEENSDETTPVPSVEEPAAAMEQSPAEEQAPEQDGTAETPTE